MTFLAKPVRLAELAAAIREALERDRRDREEQAYVSEVESRLTALTTREREVLALIVVGKLNKVFEEMFNRVGTGQGQQKGLLEGAEDEIDKLFG